MTATLPRKPAKSRAIPTTEETLKVPRLTVMADEAKAQGRKRKIKAPPPPQDILDAMSPVELEFFNTFVDDQKQRFPDMIPSDHITLYLAGFELVQLLRMHLRQMIDGELISQARQHPGVQFRQYMEMLSVTRKQRPAEKKQDVGEEILRAMLGTSD